VQCIAEKIQTLPSVNQVSVVTRTEDLASVE
jgi:hypothetical protein